MPRTHRIGRFPAIAAGVLAVGTFAAACSAQAGTQSTAATQSSFTGQFHHIKTIVSTVPHNGDVNPYGVAVVPTSTGSLVQGDILVSNFNNSKNEQGTGTTIVQVSPSGQQKVFAQVSASSLPGSCPGGVGLTTALDILPGGWVVVGSLPTTNGKSPTAKAGCLIVVGSNGKVAETLSGNGINGPWDMAATSSGGAAYLFVTNVLNGTVAAKGKVVNQGTVLRLNLKLQGSKPPALTGHTVIGSGFAERTDPNALVIGPTGVGVNSHGTLYVADSLGNRITSIPNAVGRSGSAGTGTVVTTGGRLSTPLGLTIAPNGDVLTVNGGNGLLVETTPAGSQVTHRLLDKSGKPAGAGALFGLAVTPSHDGVYYVDDAANTLRMLH
jgi:hypothetical protein